jgi:3',5'-cyclic AMP phosphodiesterase CpdA
MGRMRQFRDPELSLWQSAVDEMIAKRRAGVQAQAVGTPRVVGERPDTGDLIMREAVAYCDSADSGKPLAEAGAPAATEGLVHTAGFCSLTALKLAKALIVSNQNDIQRYRAELAKFSDCDPGYSEAAATYAAYFVAQGKEIPYRVHQNIGDFVIENKLPDQATVAIVGDWGTGQEAAKRLLKQIARKNPDVVIHLGDIYYCCTEFEATNYFYNPWSQILDLAKVSTYTLAGNHDMYSGGAAYYKLIDRLGQPASYFCLRNQNWQLVAVDTGYNDHNPAGGGGGATFLRDTEVAWLQDKIENAGGRKTTLLSHHQLFTAYDNIAGHEVNMRLYAQVKDLLSGVALWLWGHEHNFVVYGPQMGLERGRCLGHGAFPVGEDEVVKRPRFADVPLVAGPAGSPLQLGITDAVCNHGYAIMQLNGTSATVSYYQDSDENTPMYHETIP